MHFSSLHRRQLLVVAAALACASPGLALAQAKLKVAAIYSVPFEQQWVSRLHKDGRLQSVHKLEFAEPNRRSS